MPTVRGMLLETRSPLKTPFYLLVILNLLVEFLLQFIDASILTLRKFSASAISHLDVRVILERI